MGSDSDIGDRQLSLRRSRRAWGAGRGGQGKFFSIPCEFFDLFTRYSHLAEQPHRAQQAALLDVAYEGEYWRPTCASCGVKMVVRQPKDDGALFWGCVNFAKQRCTTRIQLRTSEK